MYPDLNGKTAVVTGASVGLGHGIARRFLQEGMSVVVNFHSDKHRGEAQKLADEFNAPGETARVGLVQADISQEDGAPKLRDAALEHFGGIDVWVNNAGIDTQPSAPPEVSGPFENFPEEIFREVVDVNLVGTFLACQAVGARMVKAGKGGSIINVGSIYGMLSPIQDIYAYKKEMTGVPFIKPVAYSAAKSGIYNLTRYLATYWGKQGIRVNTLTPAGVWRDTQDEIFQANFCARMPMGRMSQENEYNGALIFLASQASSFMTGSNLVIDGGWTAW